jgi:tRNA A37 threonylcarbamoyladenosine biosynthesis protein TsaE
LDEYFNDNCVLIEWPLENLIKRYNHMALSINISVTGEKRNIEIKSSNKKWLHKIK